MLQEKLRELAIIRRRTVKFDSVTDPQSKEVLIEEPTPTPAVTITITEKNKKSNKGIMKHKSEDIFVTVNNLNDNDLRLPIIRSSTSEQSNSRTLRPKSDLLINKR